MNSQISVLAALVRGRGVSWRGEGRGSQVPPSARVLVIRLPPAAPRSMAAPSMRAPGSGATPRAGPGISNAADSN
jgi:hypothetical protein